MPRIWLVVLAASFLHVRASTPSATVEAVHGLIARVLPAHKDRFVLEELDVEDGSFGAFEIDSNLRDSKVVLRGSSGVELASALGWYLKDYCGAMVSWTGDQLVLPDPLPLPSRRRTERSMKFTYYQNTCTASYSFAFYDWEKWERQIDWMALNGINFPLAFNGQEHVLSLTYQRFNLSFDDLSDFFAGPAFQAWQRMGNIYEWGGPQSQRFVLDQRDLQLKILERMRSFGMTPILTAFSGIVPKKLMEKYPDTNFSHSVWAGFVQPTYLLDIRDPLFLEIGSTFIEIQTEIYGTSHYYSTDTFNENKPPSNDPQYLRDVAHTVYESMRLSDPDAVWIMQAWIFYLSKFWERPQVEGLLSGVPDDKMILLDLFADTFPVWQNFSSFFGKSFIWCHLHNFGGRLGMYGRSQRIAEDVQRDFHNKDSSMVGIGLSMEFIDQNYFVYDLMLEQAYRTAPTNMTQWTAGNGHSSWVGRRYGTRVATAANGKLFTHLSAAWSILQRSVYSMPQIRPARVPLANVPKLDAPERSETVEESTNVETYVATHGTQSTQVDRFLAWSEFIAAWHLSESLPGDESPIAESETFLYDVVDMTREVLTRIFTEYRFQFSSGYHSRNMSQLEHYGSAMLELMADLDELLCSQKMFLLGRWLQDARSLAPEGEADLFEYNARRQITTWGPTFHLVGYATKQWCGMVGEYFQHQYSAFVERVTRDATQNETFNAKAFTTEMFDFAVTWANETDPNGVRFPASPRGDSGKIAARLFDKYLDFALVMEPSLALLLSTEVEGSPTPIQIPTPIPTLYKLALSLPLVACLAFVFLRLRQSPHTYSPLTQESDVSSSDTSLSL